MNADRVKAIVQENCAALKHACGLVDWTIRVEYRRLKDDLGHGAVQGGECRASTNYREAIIAFDPDAFETEAGVLRALRHELLHCAHAETGLYRDLVGEHVNGAAWEALDAAYTHVVERIVGNIENMLDVRLGMTPKKMIAVSLRKWEREWSPPRGRKKRKKKR